MAMFAPYLIRLLKPGNAPRLSAWALGIAVDFGPKRKLLTRMN